MRHMTDVDAIDVPQPTRAIRRPIVGRDIVASAFA